MTLEDRKSGAAFAFSPDGTRLLTGGGGPEMQLWDVASGTRQRTFETSPSSFAFSSNGDLAVSVDYRVAVRMWDVATGEMIRTFEGKPDGLELSLSLQNGRAVLGTTHRLMIWDANSGRLLQSHEIEGALAFSKDGTRYLARTQRQFLELREVATRTLIRRFEEQEASVDLEAAAFSPDEAKAASVGGSYLRCTDCVPRFWEVATGHLLRKPAVTPPQARSQSVVFAHDGDQALSAASGTVTQWDMKAGRPLRTLKVPSGSIDTLALSQDGMTLLTAGPESLHVWDMANGRLRRSFDAGTRAAALSPDGARVLATAPPEVKFLDTMSGNQLAVATVPGVEAVAFSPDGFQAVVSSSVLLGRPIGPYGDPLILTLHLLSLRGELLGSFGRVTSLAGGFCCLAFSPDGKTVLAGGSRLRLYDAQDGKFLRDFPITERVSALAFSSDGTRIVSGDGRGWLQLLDANSGEVIREFLGHQNGIRSVAFSRDGTRMLSGGNDFVAKLWSANSGELLATFFTTGDGAWIAFTPEGFFDASEAGMKLVSFVSGLNVLAPDRVEKILHRPDLLRLKLAGDPQGRVKEEAAKIVYQ